MKKLAIGVDVGGSHVSCAVCDLAEKQYLAATHTENALDNQAPASEIIRIWGQTIRECLSKTDGAAVAGIGFAMPGPFDYPNGIALFQGNNKKYEGLNGLNVAEALRKELGLAENFPIRFINDATAFAIGEDWLGKACGSCRSLSITLGTGFGSAFLKDHLPVVDGDTVPETGAVWHLPFEAGNADDYFSTRGLLNRYFAQSGVQLKGVKELAMLAPDDLSVKELFDDFGTKLGIFLDPWIRKFGVETLVIGGNISNAFGLFGEALLSYFQQNNLQIRTEVSELKESASIIGSATLADDSYYTTLLPLLAKM